MSVGIVKQIPGKVSLAPSRLLVGVTVKITIRSNEQEILLMQFSIGLCAEKMKWFNVIITCILTVKMNVCILPYSSYLWSPMSVNIILRTNRNAFIFSLCFWSSTFSFPQFPTRYCFATWIYSDWPFMLSSMKYQGRFRLFYCPLSFSVSCYHSRNLNVVHFYEDLYL